MSLYSSSVPAFEQMLDALAGVLAKAEAHAGAKKIDPAVILGLRLFPDMFPLTRQVQIACDFAKNFAARLAGIEAPRFPDEEKTFEELQQRIRRTKDFLATLTPDQMADAATRDITFPIGGTSMTMKGEAYLRHFALPNFYFHMTAAYAILRANGVAIGKRDYMGQVPGLQPA